MAKPARIKLRIDSTTNWKRSLIPLYEGEIGISYDLVPNSVTHQDEKRNFKIKIGKGTTPGSSCLWEDAADLSISKLSEEDLQTLAENIKEQLGDVFVEQREYALAMSALNNSITAIQNRLANRVKACVSNAVLVLSTDD